jgi:hypothetical protein
MEDELRRQLELHSAGATVQHAGPYSDLEVPSTMENPSNDFIQKWIAPFYMEVLGILNGSIRNPEEFIEHYSPIRPEVDLNLISKLLVWFNWRPRIVGAYFATIERITDATEHIGRLLLRSDVCYAGQGYALALATFNTKHATAFLKKYLDYYLTRKDLWFDQDSVMNAIGYLDRINGTNFMEGYMFKWQTFVADKPNHSIYVDFFEKQIDSVKWIAENSF